MVRMGARVLLCSARFWAVVLLLFGGSNPAWSGNLSEYQIKAAFLYNFASYTHWPEETGDRLNFCVYGDDPFGVYLDEVGNKKVAKRQISVTRVTDLQQLGDCQLVFVAKSAMKRFVKVAAQFEQRPVLLVTDTDGALHEGAMLNMQMQNNRVTFEANLRAAKAHGLTLSSKLLRLATQVVE